MSNIIGIYPGNFQPPHKGHLQAFDYLKKYTGENSFVATTDKVEMPNSPLTFQDKQRIWTRHGVPINKLIEVADPYNAIEVTKKFGSDRTVVVFAMSQKNANDVLKSYGGYFHPFPGMNQQMDPLNKKAYVLVIPDVNAAINKKFSPEKIKQSFTSERLTDDQKKSFFKQVFGWYDISLYDLISKKYKEASSVKERINETSTLVLRRLFRPVIKEIMNELVKPQEPVIQNTYPSLENPESPADAAKRARKEKLARDKELKKTQQELDNIKKKGKADLQINKQNTKDLENKIKSMKTGQNFLPNI